MAASLGMPPLSLSGVTRVATITTYKLIHGTTTKTEYFTKVCSESFLFRRCIYVTTFLDNLNGSMPKSYFSKINMSAMTHHYPVHDNIITLYALHKTLPLKGSKCE